MAPPHVKEDTWLTRRRGGKNEEKGLKEEAEKTRGEGGKGRKKEYE